MLQFLSNFFNKNKSISKLNDGTLDEKKSSQEKQQKPEENVFSYYDLFKAVWRFAKGCRIQLVLFSILTTAQTLSTYISVYYFGKFVDYFSNYKTGDSLYGFYTLVAIIAIVQTISVLFGVTGENGLNKLRREINFNVRKLSLQKMVEFPLAWHQKENSGNKVQKIENGATSLQQFLRSLTRDIIPIFADFIIITSIFLFLDWKYLLFFLFYIVVFFVIQNYFGLIIGKIEKQITILREKNSGKFFEAINNILTAKSNFVTQRISNRIAESEYIVLKKNHETHNLQLYRSYIFLILNVASTIGILLLIGNSFWSGLITVGTIFVYYRYYNDLRNSIRRFGFMIDTWRDQKTAIARLMPIFDEEPEIYFGEEKFPEDWQNIQLKDVSFDYPASSNSKNQPEKQAKIKTPSSLNSINFTINKGEKIGIVGKSGSGKSTLAKLLIGLYKTTQGELMVGEKDFYSISHENLTNHISIVLQDTELFNMTLEENITLLRDSSSETLQKAIQVSQLQSVIDKLPNGLQTKLGEKGYKLSGGERQRVGIARSICSEAEVLILDEATSALDSRTEQLIQQSIEKELENKTIVSIAHRLSTLKNVDRILVFENGSIIEEGKFEELVANTNSRFYSFWSIQNKGKEIE